MKSDDAQAGGLATINPSTAIMLTGLLRTTIAAALCLLATTTAATAQTALRPVDRSLSWCTTPSLKPEWARQSILLLLEERRDSLPAGSDTARLPVLHLAETLNSIRQHFQGATGLAGSSARLPAGEARYTVPAFWGELAFQLRGDGTIDSVALRDVRDSTFFNDVTAALRAGAAAGDILAFGAPTARRFMTLKPSLTRSTIGATWSMFTMEVPNERLVTRTSGRPPQFPEGLRWNASVQVHFYVDANGRPEAGTIVATSLPDSIASQNMDARSAYETFGTVSKRAVARSKFTPAEFLGCRYRVLVVQPLEFSVQR